MRHGMYSWSEDDFTRMGFYRSTALTTALH
ncbi:hypothetical protein CRE_21193 [Caenorhabditis remanei]|uniref:Uncharacterized protein n=1 Tax=Caenorhabditis remanei TaxID=31234 RepID=E3MES9_CAERE|nr:hypothetical protein CRE_21193 [Caenorhabditis remanei]